MKLDPSTNVHDSSGFESHQPRAYRVGGHRIVCKHNRSQGTGGAVIEVLLRRLAGNGESRVVPLVVSPSQLLGSVLVLNVVRALISSEPVSRQLIVGRPYTRHQLPPRGIAAP